MPRRLTATKSTPKPIIREPKATERGARRHGNVVLLNAGQIYGSAETALMAFYAANLRTSAHPAKPQ